MLDLFRYDFFIHALIGVAIIAIASAIIGTYIFARRLVAIAGGITHACFGGLGLGYFLGWNPIVTAGLFAVGSSLSVDWMSSRQKVREDSAIAVIWSMGMAVGVLFVFLTPGYVPELNSFLFGNILTITPGDIIVFAVYTLLLGVFVAARFKVIIAVAFDRDFARINGLPVTLISTLMSVFTAIGIVLIIRLVGVMLLMSMLSLPQMIAETRYHRMAPLMWASAGISLACCVGGLLATAYINVPCSALIVIIMAVVYIIARIAASTRDSLVNRRRRQP